MLIQIPISVLIILLTVHLIYLNFICDNDKTMYFVHWLGFIDFYGVDNYLNLIIHALNVLLINLFILKKFM